MNVKASSADATDKIGKIGPKISDAITASEDDTFFRIVGAGEIAGPVTYIT